MGRSRLQVQLHQQDVFPTNATRGGGPHDISHTFVLLDQGIATPSNVLIGIKTSSKTLHPHWISEGVHPGHLHVSSTQRLIGHEEESVIINRRHRECIFAQGRIALGPYNATCIVHSDQHGPTGCLPYSDESRGQGLHIKHPRHVREEGKPLQGAVTGDLHDESLVFRDVVAKRVDTNQCRPRPTDHVAAISSGLDALSSFRFWATIEVKPLSVATRIHLVDKNVATTSASIVLMLTRGDKPAIGSRCNGEPALHGIEVVAPQKSLIQCPLPLAFECRTKQQHQIKKRTKPVHGVGTWGWTESVSN